jgi:exopolysaccharide production protein ExoQ
VSAPVHPRTAAVRTFFESAQLASALSLAIAGTAFGTNAIRALIGWPGLLGILGALVVLAAFSMYARREAVEWHGLLPISLIVFMAWCAVSIIWSNYQWATLAAIIYQLVFAFLGIYLALVRDAIQIVRTIGDVLRFLLGLSLAVEILSGLLIDMPIRFLGVQGNLAQGGPISGIFGTRNELGLMALVALVTYLIELRTRSIRPGLAAYSIALSAVCLLFSRSPVIGVVLVIVLLATAALFGLRRVPAARRPFVQIGLGVVALAGIVVAVFERAPIINFLNAQKVLDARYDLWIQVWHLIPTAPLQGWGWIGFWREGIPPFSIINQLVGTPHQNALNAYLDLYLQVGLIGLLLFVALAALAISRSWVLASNKRSTIYVWPPLVLIVLLSTSLAESAVLYESGWLLLVICAVKAAQGLSWRSALPHRDEVRTRQ